MNKTRRLKRVSLQVFLVLSPW